MAIERTAQIIKGDKAVIKVKKSQDSEGSIIFECYKVTVEKTKDKVDVTQFPYSYTNYIILGKPEINIDFESYSVNALIKKAIENMEDTLYFDIEIYKDDTHSKTYTDMILISDTDTLEATGVEKYSLKFTKGR